MPYVIEHEEKEAISLEELVDYLVDNNIETASQEEMIEAAPMLAKLGNNPTFLSDMVTKELHNYSEFQDDNTYSSQVILLHPPTPDIRFFIRANIWPGKSDYLTALNGTDAFFYHRPHDHNFNFLTVGYHGPGYWSDYYEYDYGDIDGYAGEDAQLRFIERSRLEKGKLMLYRAHVDVHDQLPADSFSVSLNIMENSIKNPFLDQYSYDLKNKTIKGIINQNNTDSLFQLALMSDSGNSRDVIEHIAKNHEFSRVRLNAIHALASRQDSVEQAVSVLNSHLAAPSALVRKTVEQSIRRMEQHNAKVNA